MFELGYCSETIPVIQSRVIFGKINYYCRFRTFTYCSFNWIYDLFYVNKIKVVPSIIEYYMCPLVLAIWIMDDGGWIKNRGLKLSTNSYKLNEVKFLISVLENKFGLINLKAHSAGVVDQYILYIPKINMPFLIPLVRPHMHPIFYYKLNELN